jgi:nitrogen-specific signal transduction histidine kinase
MISDSCKVRENMQDSVQTETSTDRDTWFAPAQRSSRSELERDFSLFYHPSPITAVLDAVPMVVMVLNKNRQLVYCNQAVLGLSSANSIPKILGLRPGEILNCSHCAGAAGGCGTTEFCRDCGAVHSILESQKGRSSISECSIIVERNGREQALELRVWATPFSHQNTPFTIFTAADIHPEKRHAKLQRLFFHDIFNTLGGLLGAVEILRLSAPAAVQDTVEMMNRLLRRLTDDIESHRTLASAEKDSLNVRRDRVQSHDLLQQIMDTYAAHPAAKDRSIVLAGASQNIRFISDEGLIGRVLGNMVKNALEASEPGESVIIGSRLHEQSVQFYIHNRAVIPRDVQLRIFKRSFSTKDPHRGLGTYSMKLLSERYLHGAVTFISSPELGTTFFATYPLKPRTGR